MHAPALTGFVKEIKHEILVLRICFYHIIIFRAVHYDSGYLLRKSAPGHPVYVRRSAFRVIAQEFGKRVGYIKVVLSRMRFVFGKNVFKFSAGSDMHVGKLPHALRHRKIA